MDTLDNVARALAAGPAPWDTLPDLSLYMDQLIAYMGRQLTVPADEDGLTPSMVHNYMKQGFLPRTEGKRYNREHIAGLTAICMLKQVLPVGQAAALMDRNLAGGDARELYEYLRAMLERELAGAADLLPEKADEEALARAALELAVSAYARRLACRLLLDMAREPSADEKPRKRRRGGEQAD